MNRKFMEMPNELFSIAILNSFLYNLFQILQENDFCLHRKLFISAFKFIYWLFEASKEQKRNLEEKSLIIQWKFL